MFKVVRYCVQPYENRRGQLRAGEAMQFREKGDAMRSAELMRRRVAGAGVYEVSGWPVQDLWSEPRLVAQFGDVPDLDGAQPSFPVRRSVLAISTI